MKKSLKLISLLLLSSVFLSGCLYYNVQLPLDKDFNKTELGEKIGESKSYSVLWLVAWGDAGTKKAAENGSIKVITHADSKVLSVCFGLYSKVTTIVYGH